MAQPRHTAGLEARALPKAGPDLFYSAKAKSAMQLNHMWATRAWRPMCITLSILMELLKKNNQSEKGSFRGGQMKLF